MVHIFCSLTNIDRNVNSRKMYLVRGWCNKSAYQVLAGNHGGEICLEKQSLYGTVTKIHSAELECEETDSEKFHINSMMETRENENT